MTRAKLAALQAAKRKADRAVWTQARAAYKASRQPRPPGRHQGLPKGEYARLYYYEHRDEMLARARLYQTANREKIRDQRRRYYTANRDELLKRKRQYRASRKNKITEAEWNRIASAAVKLTKSKKETK